MTRIVMKFGGTSMAGIERIRSVAARVKREAEAGNEVLVVVSAMAGETDRLVQLCKEASALADPKEYDVVVASGEQVTAGLLAMTLQNMGVKARSFMGWQLVRASGVHGNARVETIEGALLDGALKEDVVAVIPGFQGVSDDGRVAKPGVHGEVVATGLGVMLGYLDGADVQNKLRDNPFRGAEDPGAKAVFTGDIGYLDEDGYLFLVGRSDAMLKIMGNRVYPDEVAAQLLALPGVLQAEVVGVRKADSPTRLFAFVVQARDAPAADELRRQMGTRVPAWMVPEIVFTKDAIPLTPSGKPDYPALVAEATAGAVAL